MIGVLSSLGLLFLEGDVVVPPLWGQLTPLSCFLNPYCSVRSHRSRDSSSKTTPFAGLCDTTPIATPISPCCTGDVGDVGEASWVASPPGGVEGSARVGGGPGREICKGMSLGRRGLAGVKALPGARSVLLEAAAEIMDAVVVGLLEKLRRLPSKLRFSGLFVQPRGEIGGEGPAMDDLGRLSVLGTILLMVGANTGDSGNPGRVLDRPADEGRLWDPIFRTLRSLRGGGGVSGIPSRLACEAVGDTKGVGESAEPGGSSSRLMSWRRFLCLCGGRENL